MKRLFGERLEMMRFIIIVWTLFLMTNMSSVFAAKSEAQQESLEDIIKKANAAGDTANVGELGNKPERLEWLRNNGFGMFLHWGVDSQLGYLGGC